MPKNSNHTTARSRLGRKVATAGLIIGVAFTAVGCGAVNDLLSSSSNQGTAYGSAVGSGEKTSSDTGTYEKLVVPKDSPLYVVNEGKGNPQEFTEKGHTPDFAAAGQKLVIDYVLTEMMDSSALEGGDSGYTSWLETTAPTYFSPDVLTELQSLERANSIVFGNIGGSKSMPKLINDGGPRLNNVTAKVTGYKVADIPTGTGMQYTVEFSGDYRVSDAAAAEFAALHAGTTPDQFLASDKATEAVKDGEGENVHRATGSADFVVALVGDVNTMKFVTSELRIVGYSMKTNFDYSSYSHDLG